LSDLPGLVASTNKDLYEQNPGLRPPRRNGSQPSEVYVDFLNTRNSPSILSVTREITGISDIWVEPWRSAQILG